MGLGSLFKSSSSSSSSSNTTTQYYDNSTDTNSAAELGALSHDNKVVGAGGSYVEQGITGANLDNLLGTINNLHNENSSLLSQTFDAAVYSVQSSAEKAMDTTAQAYAESDDELRRAIDGVRPIALYAMFAAIAYFIFRKG